MRSAELEEGHAMRGGVRAGSREGVGRRRRKWHARGEGLTEGWGGRAWAERTLNMPSMLVTLDVSRLSGWLNEFANCRVERRACDARGEVYAPGCGRGVGIRRRKRHARGGPD